MYIAVYIKTTQYVSPLPRYNLQSSVTPQGERFLNRTTRSRAALDDIFVFSTPPVKGLATFLLRRTRALKIDPGGEGVIVCRIR